MYSSKGYAARAEECVRLANLAQDHLVQADLLKLRQTYLVIAERLGRLAVEQARNPEGKVGDPLPR